VAQRKDFEAVYREADLFVMPSRFGRWDGRWRGEGFGIVYLEAAAFGLASVAYDCGGATDIIRHGENGMLVEPDNIAELARTIESLAKRRSLAEGMGRKAHEMVMRQFTRATIREQLAGALDAFENSSET
jgi:phosphatidylinositol alpha-1,6-mannosyltransferase